ncbi:MAG: hypothetical protein WCK89_20175 [bacterium]
MVKILRHPIVLENPFFAFPYHIGGTIRDGGHPWHGVWYGDIYDLMSVDDCFSLPQPDLATAELAARSLPALPAVIRDCCPYCWDYDIFRFDTPSVPRFNIYRGQGRQLLIPCFFWEPWIVDPPPGFQWDGS